MPIIDYNILLKELIEKDSFRMDALIATRELRLNEWCIGAGFVRNCIWDFLHGYKEPTKLSDIDICYYDKNNLDPKLDLKYERILNSKSSKNIFSVKNQARMHIKNGSNQYESTIDAIKYWPEVQTAIAVSLDEENEIIIYSVYPLERSFSLNLIRNPLFKNDSLFNERLKKKGWIEKWPNLIYPK